MNWREARYTVPDGLSLHYRDYGAGPDTVICLHGLTRNGKDFHALAQHLSARHRIIVPDLRGRGASDRDPKWKRYLPPTYVGDIWALMDQLHIESAAIIGTSLGGLMAMIMADQQPARLRGVVMNDVGPEIAPAAITRILGYVGRTPSQPDWAGAVVLARQNYEIAWPGEPDEFWEHQARIAWREGEDGRIAPDYDPAIGDALRHAMKAAGLVRFLHRLGMRRLKGINLDPWDNFRAMHMPVLLVRAALSDLVSTASMERMRAVKPDLQVVEIANRGHAPTLDEPAARAAIETFLAGL